MSFSCGIWITDIGALRGQEELWLPLLTGKRRERVMSCRNEKGRLELAAAGLLLRRVLAVSDDSQLTDDENGKPGLADGSGYFSLSHGGELAVMAAASCPVGADVEPMWRRRPIAIPRRWLTDREIAWLEADGSGARFAWLWTRLESVMKADGRGLALTRRDYSVLDDSAPWKLESFGYGGHIISVAAAECVHFPFHFITGNELFC